MTTEIKSRPVLRPAGNVALQDSRGANIRKPAKKPPASPPLKPSPTLSVKISPPNSLPTTPRASLPKSPALIKSGVSPKLSPTKLSTPIGNIKSNAFQFVAAQTGHRHASLHPPPLQSQDSRAACDIPTPQDHAFSCPPPASLDDSYVIGHALAPSDNVPGAYEHNVAGTFPDSDDKEPMHATSTPKSMSKTLNRANSDNGRPPFGVSHAQAIPSSESPATPQKKGNRRSILSRSTSENYQRGPARHTKANVGSFICIDSHSLDDTSLAQLAAAKKTAACELSAQRKLKALEYGRKPGKASRVVPDVPSVVPAIAELERCKFITAQSDPLYVVYHDLEWGVPVHDDRSLFELLVLAGAQVELSWTTILHKREAYRNVFCGYDPAVVASFNEKHIQSLESDKTLMLQGAKIRGVVENAQRVLEVVKEFGSLDTYFWSFLNYKPIVNNYRYPKHLSAKTSKSEYISKDLVRRGFRFVGPTIVYSFMQAAGMTNDHLVQCFRHKACMEKVDSLREDADEIKSAGVSSVGVGQEGECGSSISSIDGVQADPEPLLRELELQTHQVGHQHFAHPDFVHIEAY